MTNLSLTETAVRFVVASMLFDYDFETCDKSDVGAIRDLEDDYAKPWRRQLYLMFSPRLEKEEDWDLQGYSIINP
jgi:hypothetical protein